MYVRRVPVPEIQSNIGYERPTVVNFDSGRSFTLSPVAPWIGDALRPCYFRPPLSAGGRCNGRYALTGENNTARYGSVHVAPYGRCRSAIRR